MTTKESKNTNVVYIESTSENNSTDFHIVTTTDLDSKAEMIVEDLNNILQEEEMYRANYIEVEKDLSIEKAKDIALNLMSIPTIKEEIDTDENEFEINDIVEDHNDD
jgi:ribosomal silencing factor RsfS